MEWISALIASAITGAVTYSVANKQELLTEPVHIAVLLPKENCIIKLNNTSVLNTQLSIQNLGDVNDWLCIGSEFPNRAFMQGTLYSLRLYNKILTDQDITINYLLEKERWYL